MTIPIILGIIKTSLDIVLEVIKGVPVEQREKLWNDHQARMEFWTKLIEKIGPTN